MRRLRYLDSWAPAELRGCQLSPAHRSKSMPYRSITTDDPRTGLRRRYHTCRTQPASHSWPRLVLAHVPLQIVEHEKERLYDNPATRLLETGFDVSGRGKGGGCGCHLVCEGQGVARQRHCSLARLGERGQALARQAVGPGLP